MKTKKHATTHRQTKATSSKAKPHKQNNKKAQSTSKTMIEKNNGTNQTQATKHK